MDCLGYNQKVRLVLIRSGGGYVGVIANDLDAGALSYPWKVGDYQGGPAAPDTDYRIRVIATNDTQIVDESDKSFTIKDAAFSAPDYSLNTNLVKIDKNKLQHIDPNLFSISITSPQANGQYMSGQPLHIAWNKDIGVTGFITMVLLDDKGAELESNIQRRQYGFVRRMDARQQIHLAGNKIQDPPFY